MDIENIPEQFKKEAYDMIRSIYKFIPYYNQIKGTYLGMQFMLNMMGLCSSITELWAPRDDIKNFSKDATFFREDEIYAVRRFVDEVGKAKVNNYYLTSRFDVDINYQTGITLTEFNGMASTIIDVILTIKPVTRCLRKLYFILLVNTGFHFNYFLDNKDLDSNDPNNDYKDYINQKRFDYIWYLESVPELYNKTKYNSVLKHLDQIFIPYTALGAKYKKNAYDDGVFTINNSYFNLFDLDNKLKRSKQTTLKFKIYVRKKSDKGDIRDTGELVYVIDRDLTIIPERNGIVIKFINLGLKNILNDATKFFPNEPIENLDIFFATHFIIVQGTEYLYQGIGWYDWDINDLMGEYFSLVSEDSGNTVTHLISQADGDLLVPEDDEGGSSPVDSIVYNGEDVIYENDYLVYSR